MFKRFLKVVAFTLVVVMPLLMTPQEILLHTTMA